MSDLESEMLRVGRIVAADRGLEVQVRGLDAYSVPGRVVLPNIEKFEWLGRDAHRMLHGLLDHECGHAKYTEHSYMETANRIARALGVLFNSIEDGWIEKAMARDWIGVGQNLSLKNRWFWEGEQWQKDFAKGDEWSAFCVALTMLLRGAVTLDEIRTRRADVAKMIDEVPEWVLRAGAVTTTKQAYACAKGIFEHFKKPEPEPPPPSPSPPPPPKDDEKEEGGGEEEQEPSGESTEDEGEEESDDEAPAGGEEESDDEAAPDDGDEEPDGEAGGSDDGTDGSSEDDEDESSGDGGDEETEGEEPEEHEKRPPMQLDKWSWKPGMPLSPEDAIKFVITQAIKDGHLPYVVFSNDFDHERDFYNDPMPPFEKDKGPRDTIESILNDAHVASDALAQAFETALRARRDKHPVAGADEGEVDETLLAEYAVGSVQVDTIFRQFVAADDRAVAVSILIDCSGSMSDEKSRLARRAAAAMSLALSRCQVVHEVTGFTTVNSGGCTSHLWARGKEREARNKMDAMRVAIVEAEKQGRPRTIYAREAYHDHSNELLAPFYAIFKPYDLDALDGLVFGSGQHENLDGEAVLWQARRLALRPEPRRVMFVLSDGFPAGHRYSVNGSGYLKQSVERVIEAGIEVYGIGMMSNAVSTFYPRSWVAHTMEDLTTIAMDSLVEVLTQARDERACVSI